MDDVELLESFDACMTFHLADGVGRLPISVLPVDPSAPVVSWRRNLNLSLLKKCTRLREFQQFHGLILKIPSSRGCGTFAQLAGALAVGRQMECARGLFEEMRGPSTFAFNAMIRGYALCGMRGEGLLLYSRMSDSGVSPDSFTYICLLKACTTLALGRGVHGLVLKCRRGSPSEVHPQTALISYYSDMGDLESARLLFDKMTERNMVSWTAMITGYVKHKKYGDVLLLFRQMQLAGMKPNELTLASVLCACANLGALETGKWVHRYIDEHLAPVNPTLGTALVDMYMKCGKIACAYQVFEALPARDVCTWNAMIRGLAMMGHGEKAIAVFWEMVSHGTKPDSITFLAILSACTHSGLVERGRNFFSLMKEYGLEPSIKHYGCLLDLLGRAGLLAEVCEVVECMPMEPNAVIWGTVLNCCHPCGNVALAEAAMQRLLQLEPHNDGNYILMSSIYASKGHWEDAARIRRCMSDRGVAKVPGCSSIEVDGDVHEFVAGCSRHPRADEIYSMLEDMQKRLKARGYVPRTADALHNTGDKEKTQALCHHSEKLAIAFGLISTEHGATLRIVKNLRTCEDCHVATKLLSRIYGREIVVRDRHRFHHFKEGACSCNDFW